MFVPAMMLPQNLEVCKTPITNKSHNSSTSQANDVFPLCHLSTLTPRERDVISALVAGHTGYKDISRALQVQKGTIRHHMASIFDKTNVRDRVALVLWALRNGWTLGDDSCSPQNCLANLAGRLEQR